MHKSFLALTGFLLLADPLAARAAGPSCAQLTSTIRSHGPMLLYVSPGTAARPPVYDRFVRGESDCGTGNMRLHGRTVRTADGKSCTLQVCTPRDD